VPHQRISLDDRMFLPPGTAAILWDLDTGVPGMELSGPFVTVTNPRATSFCTSGLFTSGIRCHSPAAISSYTRNSSGFK
jgi:hypothetical protein